MNYNIENSRLYLKEYKDKYSKPIEIVLKDIPDKIKLKRKKIFYYLKDETKVIFNMIQTNQKYVLKIIESKILL